MRNKAFVMLLVLVTLTGCTSVPVSGPVDYHQLEQVPNTSGAQVAPQPPMKGATPELVVEGFLYAMSVYQPSYRVARAYLTPEASLSWNPDEGVSIYADGVLPVFANDNATLSVQKTGNLDPNGVYHSVSRQLLQDFELRQDVSGQWRIANPPEGLLLSRSLFAYGYSPFDRHYLNLDGNAYLPDPVWIAPGDDLIKRALQSQLNSPSEWLADLVQPTTEIEVVSVHVDADLIVVTLSAAANDLSLEVRRQLVGAMALTCDQFEGYNRIQVLADNLIWVVSEAGDTEFSFTEFSHLAPVQRTEIPSIYTWDAATEAISKLESDQTPTVVRSNVSDVSAFAVVGASSQLAVLATDKKELSAGGLSDELTPIREGEKLLPPQFSKDGELWTADITTDSLQAGTQAATVLDVPKGELTAFSISPEGDRMAVAITPAGEGTAKPQLGLLRIKRGEEVRLDGWLPIEMGNLDFVRIDDLGWSDASELFVLIQDMQQVVSVVRARIDSALTTYIGPTNVEDLVELAVAPGYQVFARSQTGVLHRYDSAFIWPSYSDQISAVTFAS
ncbi:MAG: LpqB family beta-propeller domain-containing protein [Propionibacteriaceae bacterium]|nr:LpqB family beta-propeller domain-containing protein [Propionibacteriaceae bacterium]